VDTSVLLAPCQHHTEIGMDMKKKNRPN